MSGINILLVPAYDREDLIKELFSEYTAILVEGDEKFREYLALQKYDDEFEHPGAKYAPPGGSLWLALCDGKVAGCAAMKKIDSERCEMKRVYVRSEFRGNGIGRELANRIVLDAREAGYSRVLLDTLPFLTTATAMYKSIGFHEIPRYNNNPLTDSVYLELDLRD